MSRRDRVLVLRLPPTVQAQLRQLSEKTKTPVHELVDQILKDSVAWIRRRELLHRRVGLARMEALTIASHEFYRRCRG